jgi:transposase-like protein
MSPRPRRSREQWSELVAAWRASGQSGVDFAREHGLNVHTFAWWRSELARTETPTPLTLVPVAAMHREREAQRLEVILDGGRTVRVPEQADPVWVARLIHALEAR